MKKVCIVTGGTRGIGFATVKAFLEEGYHVVLFGSRKETVDRALKKLENEDVEGYYDALTDETAIHQRFTEIYNAYGKIDVLVNNAGMTDTTSFVDYSLNKFQKVMDLNVSAAYLCSQVYVNLMKNHGNGVILNTSSMVSLYGQTSGVAYPTSKFAVNGMTKSLARELGKYGIRVNAVAPGITETDMVKSLDKSMIEPLIQAIPLKRIGKPEDIANAFVFLASDKASYITGTVLNVDGAMMS